MAKLSDYADAGALVGTEKLAAIVGNLNKTTTPNAIKLFLALGTAAVRNVGTAAGNVPVLDSGGLLDPLTLPALAITDTFVVSSQAAMLALVAQKGDVAIRTDLNKSFVLATNAPSTLADWKELLTPGDAVLSVAGLTGAIAAAALKTALSFVKADVGLGNVDNTSDANKPVSTAQAAFARHGTNGQRRGSATHYYGPDGAISASSQAIVADRLYAIPFTLSAPFPITKLGFAVTAALSGNARVGVYSNAAGDQPGTLLVDSGAISVAATGDKETTVAVTVPAGLNWLVFHSSAAISTSCINAIGFSPLGFAAGFASTYRSLVRAVAFAALPADESAQSYSPSGAAAPFVWVRA